MSAHNVLKVIQNYKLLSTTTHSQCSYASNVISSNLLCAKFFVSFMHITHDTPYNYTCQNQ